MYQLFSLCSAVLDTWNSFGMHINNTVSKRVGFNVVNILFGKFPPQRSNFLILFTSEMIIQDCHGSS